MSLGIVFYLIIGIYIFIGLQHLLIGLVSYEYKLNLYFGLFVLCLAGREYFDFLRVCGTNMHDYFLTTKFQILFFQLGTVFNLLFISEYAHIRIRKIEFVIFSIIVLLLILNFYLPYSFIYSKCLSFTSIINEHKESVAKVNCIISRGMLLWVLQQILSNMYLFVVLGKCYKNNPNKTTLCLIIVCAFIFLSIVNDDLVIAQLYLTKSIQHFAYFLLILIMTYLFLKDYAKTVELVEKQKMLKQIMKNKEELTHMIVHDLKAPLNILSNLSVDQPKEHMIEKIKNVSHKINYQIKDIMDVYRNEQTGLKIKIEECNLTDLIETAYESVNYFMHLKNLEFILESNYHYVIQADRSHVERILVNLLSNAIKYTAQHGTVKIVLTEKENKKVEIAVADQGLGIAKDKIVNVFQKFEIINKPDNSLLKSTGLGLSYCKLAVEAHGSNIKLESVEGQGTTVSFCLKFTECTERDSTIDNWGHYEVVRTFQLDNVEQEHIQGQYPDLLSCKINEITKLRKIIKAMENDDIINAIWLDELKRSIMSFDETMFNKTIFAVNDKKA